jgi:hypothetical protein
MSERKAGGLLSLSFTIDGMRIGPVLQAAMDGSAGSPPDGMRSSPWTRARSMTGRSLIESDSTQARGLEGRPLAMYSSLRLPERSRLRL